MSRRSDNSDSSRAEARAALRAMLAETAELEAVVEGPMTEAVAAWLASNYALAARQRLAAATSEEERFVILRMFVQDWAVLREGDQTAERLCLERERIALAKRDSLGKFKRKTVVGLEALLSYTKHHPKARAAFESLAEQVRHPFDPDEKDPECHDRRDDPTESD